MNIKIISGGQTGVDIIALRVANACGYETGGYATNYYMTEKGPNKNECIKLGMKPIHFHGSLSQQYLARNEANVAEADLCIVFNIVHSPGTNGSLRFIKKHKKSSIVITDLSYSIEDIIQSIIRAWPRTINFIGPRESKLSSEQIESITDIIQSILFQLGNGNK